GSRTEYVEPIAARGHGRTDPEQPRAPVAALHAPDHRERRRLRAGLLPGHCRGPDSAVDEIRIIVARTAPGSLKSEMVASAPAAFRPTPMIGTPTLRAVRTSHHPSPKTTMRSQVRPAIAPNTICSR